MANVERDSEFCAKTNEGLVNLRPVTRWGLVEDEADVKAAPASGDFVAMFDGADGGKAKKVSWEAVKSGAASGHNHDGDYYRKSETYTKDEINTALDEIREGGGTGFSKIRLGAPTGISITNTDGGALIQWDDPEDVVVSGSTLAAWSGTVIVRKVGAAPASKTDGILVFDSKTRDAYKVNGYEDTGLVNGTTYYYGIFPYSTDGVYTYGSVVTIVGFKNEHYAFTINDNESVCKSKVTYPIGVDNSNFAPAGMNGSAFSYGSWANAFFIKMLKVVMLNFDGTEAYEIDKNNYKKKVDGGSAGTEGNVMVAIPKIYYKVVDHGDGTATYHFSNSALDADYKCWAHFGLDGEEKDYCYMAAYDSCLEDGKLRSLTGKTIAGYQTDYPEISAALANNPDSSKKNWNSGVIADRLLIQLLLLLIGKNTNTQEQFGIGRLYTSSGAGSLNSGTMDDKGLFWGDTTSRNYGVKVFGIENFWGNMGKRIIGLVGKNNTLKIKMTYGTQDGSSVTGYLDDRYPYYSRYIDLGAYPSGLFYIKTMRFHKFGLLPKDSEGSETTDYADTCNFDGDDNDGIYYTTVGGSYGSIRLGAGAFLTELQKPKNWMSNYIGASLSYKMG